MKTRRFSIFMWLLMAVVVLCWGVGQAAAYVYPWPANVAPPWFNPGIGFNPVVNYDLPNYSQSPNIRKFVDKLPGLGAPGCTPTPLLPASSGGCDANNLGQYIPVAVPDQATYPGSDYYEISVKNYSTKMHTDLPPTALRGYKQTSTGVNQYLGPAIIGRVFDPTKPAGIDGNGRPVRIKFTNELPASMLGGTVNLLSHLGLPVDTTIMGAGEGPLTPGGAACDRGTAAPGTCAMYTENRVSIPHLHGGRTPWISDGTPHQWITPAGDPTVLRKGASFQNVPDMVAGPLCAATPSSACITPSTGDGIGTLYWTNQQSARLMFYHDHAYGITHLNVYKGIAAPYLLVDQVEDDLIDGTNISGGNPAATQILPNLGGFYRYGIPLVIQDKSFVNDKYDDSSFPPAGWSTWPPTPPAGAPPYEKQFNTLDVDPLWAAYVGTTGGNLWMSHEYMPVENIFDTTGGPTWPAGNLTNGRWDYGPFLIPPTFPTNLILPSPTITPEAFGDTAVVNGTAFPYIELPPDTIRFRILSAGNDRVFNLQLYYAMDKNGVICKSPNAFDAASCTEVKMVDAAPNPAYPTWPKDGRDGGVPDPTTQGPHWWQIGNEGGLLAQVADVPAQPVDYNYVRQVIPFLGVINNSLLLMPAHRADVIVDFTGAIAGDVLIVYNDAPAPMPGLWPYNDAYTDNPDLRIFGGAATTAPGFGPNTRTLAQIRITGAPGSFTANIADLQAAIPKAFAKAQDKPIVPQLAYNDAYPGFASANVYAQNSDESLNLTGVGQSIARIVTIAPGNNYTTNPTVNIIGGFPPGCIAPTCTVATATAGRNPCGGITLLTAGTGYTSPPTCTIGLPGAGGVRATCLATISGGTVNAITLDEPGSNYSTVIPATCTLSGGGGAGATCSTFVAVANTVGSIRVTNPGSGYTRQPSVYLTGGGGQMASAAALLTGAVVMTDKMITEGFDAEYGRITTMLGSIPNPLTPNVGNGFVVGMARYVDPPTEIVNDGEATLWRIGHLGVDSHALHFHLFDVQVVNRVDWTNVVKPPYPDELGWRDTIRTNPQEDIIVAFRPHQAVLPFQLPRSNRLLDPTTPINSTTNFYPIPPPPGIAAVPQLRNVMTDFGFEYVWHCHMLEHEENDFMRPLVLNVPLPPSPSPLTAAVSFPTAATVNVALTWGGATDFSVADGFTIQRATNATFTAGLVTFPAVPVPLTPPNIYTDHLIRPVAATFYYRVRAFGVAGNSPWSNVVTVSTVAPVPPWPGPLTVTAVSFPTATTASATLTWGGTTDFSVANGFTIQRATNTGFTVGLTTFTVSDSTIKTYTDATAEQNLLYYYRVRAFGVGGTSPSSNVVTVNTVQAPTAFAATVVSTPAVDSEKVHLTWTADGPPGSSFTIQRATNTTFTSGLVTSTVTPGTATLFNQLLVPNRATPYYYRIRKNATATLFSPWTAFITVPSVP